MTTHAAPQVGERVRLLKINQYNGVNVSIMKVMGYDTEKGWHVQVISAPSIGGDDDHPVAIYITRDMNGRNEIWVPSKNAGYDK